MAEEGGDDLDTDTTDKLPMWVKREGAGLLAVAVVAVGYWLLTLIQIPSHTVLAQWLLLSGLSLDALGAVVVIVPDLPRFDWIAKGETLQQIESQIERMPNTNPPDIGPFLERGDDGFTPFVKFVSSIIDLNGIPERITIAPVFGPDSSATSPSSYSVILEYDGNEDQSVGSPDTVRQLAYRYIERRILRRGVSLLLGGFILQYIANLIELMI